MQTIVIVAALLLAAYLWWRRRRIIVSENGISMVPNADRDMEKAIARARENFHFFVERLRNPQPGDENFAIKVRIDQEGQGEHLWLTDVQVGEDGIAGIIGNEPQMVPFKMGDAWSGALSSLSDWSYFDRGLMQGNFTMRAMLPRMPRAQREQYRLMLEGRWDTGELVHIPWPRDAAMPGHALPGDISAGDSVLMQGMSDHLDAYLGKCARVFHEIVSPSAHIDLYPYPATATRPFHVVVTTGMAEKPMQLPPDGPAEHAHVELVLLLPPTWPLDADSWLEERHWWPLRWLKRVARFHYETGRWLGPGHLLTHGAEPTPIDPAYPHDSVLLAAPGAMPEGFQQLVLGDGRKLRLLCLYFLDAASRGDLGKSGPERFLAALPSDRLSL